MASLLYIAACIIVVGIVYWRVSAVEQRCSDSDEPWVDVDPDYFESEVEKELRNED
jgi:hypothetical protein